MVHSDSPQRWQAHLVRHAPTTLRRARLAADGRRLHLWLTDPDDAPAVRWAVAAFEATHGGPLEVLFDDARDGALVFDRQTPWDGTDGAFDFNLAFTLQPVAQGPVAASAAAASDAVWAAAGPLSTLASGPMDAHYRAPEAPAPPDLDPADPDSLARWLTPDAGITVPAPPDGLPGLARTHGARALTGISLGRDPWARLAVPLGADPARLTYRLEGGFAPVFGEARHAPPLAGEHTVWVRAPGHGMATWDVTGAAGEVTQLRMLWDLGAAQPGLEGRPPDTVVAGAPLRAWHAAQRALWQAALAPLWARGWQARGFPPGVGPTG